MKLLAVELSTCHGTVALLEDGQVVEERAWEAKRGSEENLFTLLPGLVDESGWAWEDLDVLTAGRGPGMYSSLRTSMAAVQACALPTRQRVFTVSSGEVLAFQTAQECDAGEIVVVGDARRERVWFRVFSRQDDVLNASDDWALSAYSDLGARLPKECLMVSPDWGRLESIIEKTGTDHKAWLARDCYPTASALGRLVYGKILRGETSEPLVPIYMHPPVFVKPSFTE